MIYTSYTEEQYKALPSRYRIEVLGISYKGNIIQIPLCPECGNYMMPVDDYLSCIVCGHMSRKRVIRDEESGNG